MMPSHAVRLARIQSCVSDLSDNGIDLHDADDGRLGRVIQEYLEYFQLMLGYEAEPGEIIDLLRDVPSSPTRAPDEGTTQQTC